MSQAPFPANSDLTKFFSDFSAFFGFSKGFKHTSFSDMVSDVVAQQLENRFTNQISLTASQSTTNPLPNLRTTQKEGAGVGSGGGGRGNVTSTIPPIPSSMNDLVPSANTRSYPHPPPSIPLGVLSPKAVVWGEDRKRKGGLNGDALSTSTKEQPNPSSGKRSRPCKDVPWKVKRSRPEVGGFLALPHPGYPGRDQGGDERTLSAPSLHHSQAQGEGHVPKGGETQATHSLPPLSTQHFLGTSGLNAAPQSAQTYKGGETRMFNAPTLHQSQAQGEGLDIIGAGTVQSVQPLILQGGETQATHSLPLQSTQHFVGTSGITAASLSAQTYHPPLPNAHFINQANPCSTGPLGMVGMNDNPPLPKNCGVSSSAGLLPGNSYPSTSAHTTAREILLPPASHVENCDPFEIPVEGPQSLPSDEEGALENSGLSTSQMNFNTMLAYITRCFPEAQGVKVKANRPEPPGEDPPQDRPDLIRLTRAKPMDFTLEQASQALSQANETSRPSLARYPRIKYRSVYTVSGHEVAGEASKLNPELALALTNRGKDPQVMVQHADMTRLEGIVARLREVQNFTFWCMGAFFRLFSSLQPGGEDKLMGDQLFTSIQKAMVDMAKDSAFVLANVKAMRRESVLACLPSSYKTTSKVNLRKSSLDSALLFDDHKVQEAMKLADQAASISFQQAAVRALAKPRLAQGTTQNERSPRTNPIPPSRQSSSFRRPTYSTPRRQTSQQQSKTFSASNPSIKRNNKKFFRK